MSRDLNGFTLLVERLSCADTLSQAAPNARTPHRTPQGRLEDSPTRRLVAGRLILLLALLGGVSWAVATEAAGTAQPAPLPPADNAQALADESADILDMDIDQLAMVDVRVASMEVEVTSVSRTAQPIGRTAAAVYVVTNEMIRRCGARNIPEVLRTVPGVEVARISASCWAITIRGFSARFANKLLVQIDGVAIYNPTHSGVFWEREPVMLEDVDRIEVIRGPGATVWGANAVNGIINIVTKSAKDTTGIYADVGVGNEHRQFGDLRVGGRAGNLSWRAYGMTMEDDQGYVAPPNVAADDPRLDQAGFRVDWTRNCCDTVTLQGDFYGGEDNQGGSYVPPSVPSPMDCSRTMMLARWARRVDENTDWAL
jgi:iron complex outermembrane receptor protein